MINKEFEYTLKDDIYYPNIEATNEKPIILNKYGRMRLKFLKEHKRESIWLVEQKDYR